MNIDKIDVPVGLIDLDPENYNSFTEEMFDKLKNGIEKYGFLRPILVKRTGKRFLMIDGEHRYLAAVRLGYKEVPVWACPSDLSDRDRKIIQINMNQLIGDSPDGDRLNETLQDIFAGSANVDELLKTMPFTKGTLDLLDDLCSNESITVPVRKPKADLSSPGHESKRDTHVKWTVEMLPDQFDFVKSTLEKVKLANKIKSDAAALIILMECYVKELGTIDGAEAPRFI